MAKKKKKKGISFETSFKPLATSRDKENDWTYLTGKTHIKKHYINITPVYNVNNSLLIADGRFY